MNLRSKELADSLVDQYDLKNNSKEGFLKVFQTPDTIEQNSDAEILIYYFNSNCSGKKLIKESDVCYAAFYFASGKLTDSDFVCE